MRSTLTANRRDAERMYAAVAAELASGRRVPVFADEVDRAMPETAVERSRVELLRGLLVDAVEALERELVLAGPRAVPTHRSTRHKSAVATRIRRTLDRLAKGRS